MNYGKLEPGLYLQWGSMVKAVDVAQGTDAFNWAKLFGLEKVDDDLLANREVWTFTALANRAEELLSVPRAWMVGEDTELDSPPFGMVDAHILVQIDKALQIKEHGAFLHKIRQMGKGKVSRLIWLDPDTITPDYKTATHEKGVLRFERTVNARREWIMAKDMLWFRRPGQGELRGDPAPIEASRLDAEILYNMRRMMDSLYEANGLPIMLVMVPAGTSDAHKEELQTGFWNLFNRMAGTRQVKTLAVREGVEVKAIQLTPNDLHMDETEKRHGPAVLGAHLVPESVARSTAANYATAESERIRFAGTMATRLEAIADVFNSDPDIMAAGVRLEVRRDQLPVLSDDVLKSAQAFQAYVAAGLPVEVAAAEIGIEIPDGMIITTSSEILNEVEPADELFGQVDAEKTMAKMADLGRLRRWCENGSFKTKIFESELLTPEEIREVIEAYAYDFDGKTYRP